MKHIMVTTDFSELADKAIVPAAELALKLGAKLTLSCPTGGGGCVADAVLVESLERLNDGAEVPSSVVVNRKDGLFLRRVPAPAGCSKEFR